MIRLRPILRRFRDQPDRPMVLLYGHLVVVVLYLTGNAVTPLPFRHATIRTLVDSPILPTLHLTCAAALLLGLTVATSKTARGTIAFVDLWAWVFTTVTLYQGANDRTPHLSKLGAGLASVMCVAAFLMLKRWGNDAERDGED
jgi:uncharacterized membrane protein